MIGRWESLRMLLLGMVVGWCGHGFVDTGAPLVIWLLVLVPVVLVIVLLIPGRWPR